MRALCSWTLVNRQWDDENGGGEMLSYTRVTR